MPLPVTPNQFELRQNKLIHLPTGAQFTDRSNGVRVEATPRSAAPTRASVEAEVVPGLRDEGAEGAAGPAENEN